jgi:predicted amidophosphoribosyltransferase
VDYQRVGAGGRIGRPPSPGEGWSALGEPLAGCPVCGQARPQPGPCPNRWCHRADRGFSVVFAVGVHEGALRHAILRYKYGRETWWAGVFARLFADHLAAHATWFEEFDLLVPTPAYTGRRARRDWDPVGEIAGRLEGLVTPLWEIAAGAVEKRAETPAMQGRPWADRQHIAAGPLRRSLAVLAPGRVAEARILVLDDVLTEGGTLREVAHALRRAGAREVAGLVLARQGWRAGRPVPPAGRDQVGRP